MRTLAVINAADTPYERDSRQPSERGRNLFFPGETEFRDFRGADSCTTVAITPPECAAFAYLECGLQHGRGGLYDRDIAGQTRARSQGMEYYHSGNRL